MKGYLQISPIETIDKSQYFGGLITAVSLEK
jgi:hypothetical protein